MAQCVSVEAQLVLQLALSLHELHQQLQHLRYGLELLVELVVGLSVAQMQVITRNHTQHITQHSTALAMYDRANTLTSWAFFAVKRILYWWARLACHRFI